jgi:RNA polymerase sigma-70 factor (ECF subfamily)
LTDEELAALLIARDPEAFNEVEAEFGYYIRAVMKNFLKDKRDIEECVYDTLNTVLEHYPENAPKKLGAYIAVVARNIAVNKYKELKAAKRGGGVPCVPLHELRSLASNKGDPYDELMKKEFTAAVEGFLLEQPELHRRVFIQCFWYNMSISETAKANHTSKSNVAVITHRLCAKLKEYLTERDFEL